MNQLNNAPQEQTQNPLRGKVISFSQEFIKGLKPAYTMQTTDKNGNPQTVRFPVSGRTAAFLLIGLTQMDSKAAENSQWVQLYTGDVKDIFGIRKLKYKDFSDFITREGRKVQSITVNGIQIVDCIYTEGKILHIHYTDEAMQFFQGLGPNRRFLQISTDALIATDCRRDDHTWNWLRYLLMRTCTGKTCSFRVSTGAIKRLLDIPFDGKGSYMRDCGFDRKRYEDQCLTLPLMKIAHSGQYHINMYKDNTGVERPWRKIKDENNTTAYGHVEGYEVVYRYLFPHVKKKTGAAENAAPIQSDSEIEGEFRVCI